MLTSIGKRGSDEARTMRDLLTDCHGRIRRFCALGKRLAESGPREQVRDAAAELERYFALALPLHVRDEDESVRPRLERLDDPAVRAALATMSAEHAAADAPIAELVERWRAIAGEPTDARCHDTARAAAWLDEHMTRHLRDEETILFPALDRLPRV
jgi:hemerythrin-like domain-containing protein